ncbi:MAG: hypothetical protein AUJ07_10195 [Crenarchaeota archaeon 13_1_40CM_3_53_5]|nr:MAG: hypothetical protein AUJ07_10195 [Crenarchaeota archaeon 13_1_40CM_3_53_5]
MVDSVFLVLLVLHVGSIVAWMGGAALFVSVIAPSLGKMSPASRAEFITSALPRYLRFVGGSSVIAIIAGLSLYAYATPSGSGAIYVQSGAGLGLVVLIIALGVMIPSGRRLVSLVGQMSKPQTTPPSESSAAMTIASLQKRLTMAGRLGVTLLAFAMILMVVGASI